MITEPKPIAEDCQPIKALSEETTQIALASVKRLDVATTVANGLLASQGWPWTDRAGKDEREEGAARFAGRCFTIADALLEANKTKVVSQSAIQRELAQVVADESYDRAG